jgi:predicted dehydrogenase
MGQAHARAIAQASGSEMHLAAVSDSNPAAKAIAEELAVPFYQDAQRMVDDGGVDAALIATPHYLHAPLAIRMARAKVHVLSEKPLAVDVGAARAMVSECRKHGVALGAMLQGRLRANIVRLKQMIDQGELGRIHQVSLVCSAWYRTQAYYDSGTWRGTWAGEGGGVLLNQAAHHLDLVQWLIGRPRRVSAFLETRLHRIEVENTANILWQYDNGCAAYLYFTTAQAPRQEQLCIFGDKGAVQLDGATLRFARLSEPLSEHVFTCQEKRADFIPEPAYAWETVPVESDPADLRLKVVQAFAGHLLYGHPMVATGEDAAVQVELTNAAYLSGLNRQVVELPMSASHVRRVDELLNELAARGRNQGPSLRSEAAEQLRALMPLAESCAKASGKVSL